VDSRITTQEYITISAKLEETAFQDKLDYEFSAYLLKKNEEDEQAMLDKEEELWES